MKSYINYAIKAAVMFAVGAVIVNTLVKRVPGIGPQAGRVLGGL